MARTKKLQIKSIKKKKSNYLYTNQFLEMINQRLMRNGKKNLASRILQKSLINIQNKIRQDPLIIIEKAIRNTTPSVEIQTRRVGGTVYSIPVEINLVRGMPRAIGWLLSAAKKRSGSTIDINLANEFIDASKKVGNAFHKKEELHKMADANARPVFAKKKINKK